MSDTEQNKNEVTPVTPVEVVTPVNTPKTQVEPLGLTASTIHLLKLEEEFNCSIEKLSVKERLGDLVKMASCLSDKTIPEICDWIDKYGVEALTEEFTTCLAKINEKKAQAVR